MPGVIDEAVSIAVKEEESGAEDRPGSRILVVDDEQGLRDMFCYALTARGYEVVTAAGGGQALEILKAERFDLVISDVCMPGTNGITLMDDVRRALPGVEIVITTAYATVPMAVEAMKRGAFDFLTKPVDEAHLAATVRHALKSGEMKSQIGLYKSSLALFRSIELSDVLPVIVNQACRLLGADHAAILTRSGRRIRIAARSDEASAAPVPAGLFAAACARCGDSVQGVALVPAETEGLASRAKGVRALLIQPLAAGGRTLGYLAAARMESAEPFDARSLRQVVLFAAPAAQAVHNARLFHELRATQGQLLQAQKLAVAGRLAAGIAHEINTPLSCIYGNVQMALEEEGLSAETRESLESVVVQTRHCRDVVVDLLEFIRPRRFKRETQELYPILESALTIACLESSRAPTIVREWPEPSPRVRVDPIQIKQIVVNLARNAFQSMKDREAFGLTVRVSGGGGRVRIRIEDQGPGIDPRHLSRLFDPFFTTKSPGAGTGLGLYLCQLMAERNGGSISAGNRDEGGAVFTIDLAAARGSAFEAGEGEP